MKMEPVRLTNSDYMEGNSFIRIFRHTVDEKVELHWHEFYEMAIIISGEGNHYLNGSLLRLKSGSLLFLTPADFHEVEPDPGDTLVLLNMIFLDEALSQSLQRLMVHSSEAFQTSFGHEQFQKLLTEFEIIWDEQQQESTVGSALIRRGALERILLLAERKLQQTAKPKVKHEFLKPAIRNAIKYMHHHFREPLSLAKVAAHSNTSTNYFSELFHKEIGSSFQIYLQELRLRFASSLLQASELSVLDICLASGFNTVSHFDRTFKLKFGCSPTNYRKQHRK